MIREEEKNKARWEYVSKRLANPDFPTYNEEYELEAAWDDGAKWEDTHPHWISVKDRKPEVGVAVLTTTQHGTQRVGWYEDGWWLANSPNLVRMGSITHWMSLPALPEHIADVSQKISSSKKPTN